MAAGHGGLFGICMHLSLGRVSLRRPTRTPGGILCHDDCTYVSQAGKREHDGSRGVEGIQNFVLVDV